MTHQLAIANKIAGTLTDYTAHDIKGLPFGAFLESVALAGLGVYVRGGEWTPTDIDERGRHLAVKRLTRAYLAGSGSDMNDDVDTLLAALQDDNAYEIGGDPYALSLLGAIDQEADYGFPVVELTFEILTTT